MRLRFWDRVLAFIYVLMALGLCALAALRSFGMDYVGRFYDDVRAMSPYWYLIFYGIVAIFFLLSLYMLKLIFARRPKGTAFVTVDSGEKGKVVIAISALEQLVRQAANRAEGVTDMKINVRGEENAISLLVELTVLGGEHLPTVTSNLQRDIRSYVEENCGVAVRNMTVTVGAVLPPPEGAVPKHSEAPAPAPAFSQSGPSEERSAEEPAYRSPFTQSVSDSFEAQNDASEAEASEDEEPAREEE